MADDLPALGLENNSSFENRVEYMVFVTNGQEGNGRQLSALEGIRKKSMQLCELYTKDHIWQRESFSLEVKSEQGLLYLYGSTEYGDCVEDEWLVVFLLREISKSCTDTWIRVFDGDGEFLFIEAAGVVPKWLSPDNDAHRAWISNGELYIIPSDAQPGHKPRAITLPEAVSWLRATPKDMLHSSFVEAEAFYRLEKYPDCITGAIHHALVTIPRRLAYILHDRPRSVAPAIEAFYLRDPLALRPIVSASPALRFPPIDLVTVSVRFTRTLYAQLRSQRFDPPPQWCLLLETAAMQSPKNGDGISAKSLLEAGMKLTIGFEILLATASTSNNRLVREIAIVVEDIEEDGDDNTVLPPNQVIETWRDVKRHDDDSWLDINYEDFERELEGRSGRKWDLPKQGGFGDATAQADLRKIVERFEGFLNDDQAGLDGAQVGETDDEDEDGDDEDDEDDEDYGDSDDEDKNVSFDEAEFESMMRQMMGLPGTEIAPQDEARAATKNGRQVNETVEEDEEIRRLAEQFGSELNSHGALRLDPVAPKRSARLTSDQKANATNTSSGSQAADDESADEEIDIDYNLAKNLLESFKGQTGMPGPAGNLLRMMGMSLPRDEGDDGRDDDDT